MNADQSLLRAILLESGGAEAVEAYRTWKQQVDFEALPANHFVLLPRLYKNLEGQITDELTPRLKGIFRQAWVRAQASAQIQAQTLEQLRLVGLQAQCLDDAADPLARADLQVEASLSSIRAALGSDWFEARPSASDQRSQDRQWQARGWVTLKHRDIPIRFFRQPVLETELWLHRLEFVTHDLVWLTRFVPYWNTQPDWQPLFTVARKRGLSKRLHVALEIAEHAGVLNPNLNGWQDMTFSSFEQAEFLRTQNHSRLKRVWLTLHLVFRGNVCACFMFWYRHLRSR